MPAWTSATGPSTAPTCASSSASAWTTIAVSSDVGMMGGSLAHEFMVLNPAGEDVLVLCEACGYAANRQVAIIPKPAPAAEDALPLEEVATPGTTTIATLAAFLGIGAERTAKAAFFVTGDGRLVTAIVRGDHEVNETKLVNAVAATGGIRPATVEEIKAAGMEPGYGSPIGAHDTVVVVDDLVAASPNLVAGANREGFHYRNVNVGRDFTADVTADITNAQEGDPCPTCGKPVILRNGIEVGNIFKLGTQYTRRLRGDLPRRGRRGAPDRHGLVRHRRRAQRRLHRRGAPRREGHHLARRGRPYAAHLVSIGAAKDPQVTEIAERLHALAARGRPRHEILWDDRDESPGVKFTDAELLGMPWILTVSPRSLAAGGIEVTERATGERGTRPIEEVERFSWRPRPDRACGGPSAPSLGERARGIGGCAPARRPRRSRRPRSGRASPRRGRGPPPRRSRPHRRARRTTARRRRSSRR